MGVTPCAIDASTDAPLAFAAAMAASSAASSPAAAASISGEPRQSEVAFSRYAAGLES